jgi:hypothetical protein
VCEHECYFVIMWSLSFANCVEAAHVDHTTNFRLSCSERWRKMTNVCAVDQHILVLNNLLYLKNNIISCILGVQLDRQATNGPEDWRIQV